MIQIDMQMPSNCIDCPACNEYLMCAIPANGRGWGENDVHEFDQGRPEWCPLKEQELVRCKDCKYGKPQIGEIYCEAHEEIGYDPEPTHPLGWFCADAERKDGDGE